MTPGPAPGPGRDQDPARRCGPGDPLQDAAAGWRRLPAGADWMDDEQWAARPVGQEPPDPDRYPDPEDPPLPGEADLDALIAECREITAPEARAAALAAAAGTTAALAATAAKAAGRRGPQMPGSECFPGEYPGPAGGFASGLGLDTMPGGLVLMSFADDAAGEDDTYPGASDDELAGAICAWDRVQSHAAARKHAAAAEFIRRRPAPGCVPEGPARMPAGWEEFTGDELAPALAQSAWAAASLLELAWDLAVKLPGTAAAFRAGIVQENKARIIAAATQLLDPVEARAAEALVLGRAGTLTPGGLRAAIARAVMQVAPDKARKRREEAAKDARVERWAEDSGNAALVGRELPPAEVLAADQRVTWWARQLRKAGLDGRMDELRARAYLDILLGIDSRPAPQPAGTGSTARSPGPDDDGTGHRQHGPDGDGPDGNGPDGDGPDGNGPDGDGPDGDGPDGDGPGGGGPGPGQPGTGARRARGRGDPAGVRGPAEPDGPAGHRARPGRPARRSRRDRPGRPVAGPRPGPRRRPQPEDHLVPDRHRPARPPHRPRLRQTRTSHHPARRARPGARAGPDPPHPPIRSPPSPPAASTGHPAGTGPGGCPPASPGQRDLIVTVEPIGTDPCDHRREAPGHDPGVMLRHLAQIRYATCTGPACRRPAAQVRLRAQHPVRGGRPELPVQRRP